MLTVGEGPRRKVLEAYMGEAALPIDPPEHTWQCAPGGLLSSNITKGNKVISKRVTDQLTQEKKQEL
jgi:hypothetical protein